LQLLESERQAREEVEKTNKMISRVKEQISEEFKESIEQSIDDFK
jgi:hypothetical protein